jgi:hypothetical protein
VADGASYHRLRCAQSWAGRRGYRRHGEPFMTFATRPKHAIDVIGCLFSTADGHEALFLVGVDLLRLAPVLGLDLFGKD